MKLMKTMNNKVYAVVNENEYYEFNIDKVLRIEAGYGGFFIHVLENEQEKIYHMSECKFTPYDKKSIKNGIKEARKLAVEQLKNSGGDIWMKEKQ